MELKNKTELGERIQKIIDLSGKNKTEFAELIGVLPANLNRWIQGENAPSYEYLVKIGEIGEVSFDWLIAGIGKTERDYSMTASNLDRHYGEFVFVPLTRGEISAGEGFFADTGVDMRVAFRRDWIARKGDPMQMSLIRVRGDSMYPTLFPGDVVLVDHQRNYIDPEGGIYALALDSSIMIKRVQPIYPSGMMEIRSDNAAYRPLELRPDQIKVNGKVIWFARELEK